MTLRGAFVELAIIRPNPSIRTVVLRTGGTVLAGATAITLSSNANDVTLFDVCDLTSYSYRPTYNLMSDDLELSDYLKQR